jgi:hypothetical protein
MVPGFGASGVDTWTENHRKAWIDDPTGNVRYEAHQYFDQDKSGRYQNTYQAEVERAQDDGY